MKKIIIYSLILSLLSPFLQAYKNDSISLVGGVSSITLMAAALAHGKIDQKGIALFTGGVTALGIGHHFANKQGLYTAIVLTVAPIASFVGLMLGVMSRLE